VAAIDSNSCEVINRLCLANQQCLLLHEHQNQRAKFYLVWSQLHFIEYFFNCSKSLSFDRNLFEGAIWVQYQFLKVSLKLQFFTKTIAYEPIFINSILRRNALEISFSSFSRCIFLSFSIDCQYCSCIQSMLLQEPHPHFSLRTGFPFSSTTHPVLKVCLFYR
jgi:hypothetical protein